MQYLYESHTGGLFITEDELSVEECFCETCFDYDEFIGTFETIKDFWNIVKNRCSLNGSGGLSLQWLLPFIADHFDDKFVITYDSYSDQAQGFCSNTDTDIVKQIETICSNY